jgi:bacterioferritin
MNDREGQAMESVIDKARIIGVLNRVLETELAGVVRYTHYSFMIFGFSRIPIVSWLRSQADESLLHAREAGEMVTLLGGHPSLGIGDLLECAEHDMSAILRASIGHERHGLGLYGDLLALVEDRDVMLEEYARRMIAEETKHISEVDKMLRHPGALGPAEG